MIKLCFIKFFPNTEKKTSEICFLCHCDLNEHGTIQSMHVNANQGKGKKFRVVFISGYFENYYMAL